MFHDLYERPWQNSGIKKERLTNRHGFVHPIEAVINANTWYPKYFESDLKSKIIIDGVIHICILFSKSFRHHSSLNK